MRTLAAALLCFSCASQTPRAQPQKPRLARESAIVIDAHSDVTEPIFYEGYDFFARHDDHAVDLPRMKEGGVDAEVFAVFVHPESVDLTQFFPTALKQIDKLQEVARARPKEFDFARNSDEVRDNAARGVVSMLLSVEGGHMLLPGSEEEELQHLKTFADRGVRILTLAWSSSSPFGGSTAQDASQGLTDFGHKALAEMERLGIVADLSHGSEALFRDVIKAARRPILLSHSDARALSNHPRNASDEMLVLLRKNGGAICLDFSRTFLSDEFRRAPAVQQLLKSTKAMRNDEKAKLYAKEKLPEVPMLRLAEHIDHVAQIVGFDHVCLGSDFEGAPLMASGMEDIAQYPQLIALLRTRGWTDENLKKLLGENVLRVLAAAEEPLPAEHPTQDLAPLRPGR